MTKELIDYKSYFRRRIEAGAGILVGFLLLGGLMMFITEFPETPFFLIILVLLTGLVSLGYGIYLQSKLYYERENEGVRLYHYKGRF